MKLFWAAAAFVSLLIGSGMSSADQNLPTLVIGGDDLEVLPSKYKWHVRARKARVKVEARTEDTRELVRIVHSCWPCCVVLVQFVKRAS